MFELQSLADMGEPNNRKDALCAFDQCVTDADFAAWARRFGRPLARAEGVDLQAELDEAHEDANELEGDLLDLKMVVNNVVDDLNGVKSYAALRKPDELIVLAAITALENAL